MSDYMLDFSNDGLEDGKERQAVDEGEYTVRLKDWRSDDDGKIKLFDKNDHPYIQPIIEIINCEEAEYSKDIRVYMPMIYEGMDKKDKNDARFKLRSFMEAFGFDYTQPLDPEAMIGAEAEALLIVKEDTGYGEQNDVRRWIVSH